MRRILLAAMTCLALLSSPMAAEKARTSGQASRSGFGVVVSIVTDPNWKEIWNTPAENTPNFHTSSTLKVGQKAWLLSFFSGAKLKNGVATLKCDLKITDPDGSVDKHPAQLCFQGPASGPEGMMFMTGLEVGFEVAPSDLEGLTTFEVGITDVNRGVRVPVKVSIAFETGNSAT